MGKPTDSTLHGIYTKPGVFALAMKNFNFVFCKCSSTQLNLVSTQFSSKILSFLLSFKVAVKRYFTFLSGCIYIIRLHIYDCVLLLNILCSKNFYTARSYFIELMFIPVSFFNAKNLQKYSFIEFRGVNVSEFWEIAPNHYGCYLIAFTYFADHFIIFN